MIIWARKKSLNIIYERGKMVEKLTTILFMVILFASFLFRGSFFQWEQTVFTFFMLSLFFLWMIFLWLKKEKLTFQIAWQDGIFFLVILGYGISLISPEEAMGAWKEFGILVAIFLSYLMIRHISKENKPLFIIGYLLISIVVSVLGLLAFFGFTLPFNALYAGNRIGSTLQYPNTLALINIIGIIFSNYFLLWRKHIIYLTLGAIGLYINIVTFLLSQSRGGLLVYLLIGLLALILIPWRNKLSYIFYNGIGLGIGVLLLNRLVGGVGQSEIGITWLLLGLLTTLIAVLLVHYLTTRLNKNLTYLLMGILAVAVSYGIFFLLNNSLIPTNIMTRMQDINLDTLSVVSRLGFMEAAWRIIQANPLGVGGEGWQSIYYDYMSEFFIAREVHSHFLQVGVEAGFIGMIGFILFGFVITFLFIKDYLVAKDDSKYISLVTGLAFLSIFLHSSIDFDLSYTSVAFLYYGMAGLAPVSRLSWPISKKGLVLLMSVTIGFMYLMGTMSLGSYYSKEAEIKRKAGEVEQAIINYQKAIDYIPTDSMSMINLVRMDEKMDSEDKQSLLHKALKYNPHRPEVIHYYINEQMKLENYQEAFNLAPSLLRRQPVSENFQIFFNSARYYIRDLIVQEDQEKLLQISQEIIKVLPLLEQEHYNRKFKYSLNEVEHMVLGQAYYFLKEYGQAEQEFLIGTKNPFIKVESEMWLILTYGKIGELEKRATLINKPLQRFLPQNEIYKHLLKF